MQVDQSQIVRIIADHGRKLERLETLPAGSGGAGGVHATIGYIFNKGSGVLSTDMVGEIRAFFTGTIIRWSVVASPAGGTVRFNIKRSTYAGYPTMADIDGTDPAQLAAAQKAESTALTGWSTGITLGDVLRFEIDPAVAPLLTTRAVVSLECTIP